MKCASPILSNKKYDTKASTNFTKLWYNWDLWCCRPHVKSCLFNENKRKPSNLQIVYHNLYESLALLKTDNTPRHTHNLLAYNIERLYNNQKKYECRYEVNAHGGNEILQCQESCKSIYIVTWCDIHVLISKMMPMGKTSLCNVALNARCA